MQSDRSQAKIPLEEINDHNNWQRLFSPASSVTLSSSPPIFLCVLARLSIWMHIAIVMDLVGINYDDINYKSLCFLKADS